MENQQKSFFARLGHFLRRWAEALDYDPVGELHQRVQRLEAREQGQESQE